MPNMNIAGNHVVTSIFKPRYIFESRALAAEDEITLSRGSARIRTSPAGACARDQRASFNLIHIRGLPVYVRWAPLPTACRTGGSLLLGTLWWVDCRSLTAGRTPLFRLIHISVAFTVSRSSIVIRPNHAAACLHCFRSTHQMCHAETPTDSVISNERPTCPSHPATRMLQFNLHAMLGKLKRKF
jgi:hypothetical protein